MTIDGAGQFWYGDLSEDHLARTWKDNPAGTEVRMQNHFAPLGVINRGLNHILGKHGPVVWSHCVQDGDFDKTGSVPLFATKWFDGIDNATYFRVHVIALARESGSGDATVNFDGVTAGHNELETGSSVAFPQDAYYFSFDVNRGAVSDAAYTTLMNTYNGMTIHSVTIQQLLPSPMDTSLGHQVVGSYPFAGGDPVIHDTVEATRAALHEARSTYMGLAFSWSAVAEGDSWLTPGSTSENGIVINNSTYKNVIDQSYTTRTDVSPGWHCSARYMGVGDETTTAGKSVYITPYIFCRCAVDYSGFAGPPTYGGQVRFDGPAGASVTSSTTTVPYSVAPAWIECTPLCVNSTIADSATDVTANKIDCRAIALNHDNGDGYTQNTLYIYGIVGVYTIL